MHATRQTDGVVMTWPEIPVNITVPNRAAGSRAVVHLALRVLFGTCDWPYGRAGTAVMGFILERKFSILNRRL